MSVSHGHSTIGGIEYGGCGEDKKGERPNKKGKAQKTSIVIFYSTHSVSMAHAHVLLES